MAFSIWWLALDPINLRLSGRQVAVNWYQLPCRQPWSFQCFYFAFDKDLSAHFWTYFVMFVHMFWFRLMFLLLSSLFSFAPCILLFLLSQKLQTMSQPIFLQNSPSVKLLVTTHDAKAYRSELSFQKILLHHNAPKKQCTVWHAIMAKLTFDSLIVVTNLKYTAAATIHTYTQRKWIPEHLHQAANNTHL